MIAVEEVPHERNRQVRHRRCDADRRSRREDQARGRKTEARRRAVEPRDRRPLRAARAHLRVAGKDHAGRRRRDPADRCDRGAARGASRCSLIVSPARVSIAATRSVWCARPCIWRCRMRRSARRRGNGYGIRESGFGIPRERIRAYSRSQFPNPKSQIPAFHPHGHQLDPQSSRRRPRAVFRRGRAADHPVVDLCVSDRREDARRIRRELDESRLHARQQSDRRDPAQEGRRAGRRRGLPDVRQRRCRDFDSGHRKPARRRSCDLRRPALQLDARGAARPARALRRHDEFHRRHRHREFRSRA